MIFVVLSFLETVHDTVLNRYCIFSLLYRLLMIGIKRQNPLLSHVQARERVRMYAVNVQCSVQYTLLLLYLMLVISCCA